MILVHTKAVKYFMRQAGYKRQVDLAAAMGISRITLNRIVNNKSEWRRRHLDRLCALLNVQPGQILEYRSDSA